MCYWHRSAVTLIIIPVYISYLVFQLWSHTHFYEDSKTASDKLSRAIKKRNAGKRPGASDSQLTLVTPRKLTAPYESPSPYGSDADFSRPKAQERCWEGDLSNVNLMEDQLPDSADHSMHHKRHGSRASQETTTDRSPGNSEPPTPTSSDSPVNEEEQILHPRLSWVMTLLLLTAVTIVCICISLYGWEISLIVGLLRWSCSTLNGWSSRLTQSRLPLARNGSHWLCCLPLAL